ncbi:MAG: ribonuclease HI family protein [Candidatus Micrarchaeota archaeon]|nr:ribonuclease HI family protein [Candidatus Micrarchaeota archaeon]
MSLVIYTDGACYGNPGPMGVGVVAYKDDKIVWELSEYIGEGTNNIAEYTALIRALEFASSTLEKTIHIRSDSELMVKQLTGKYKVKDIKLKVLYGKAIHLCGGLQVTFEHIPREKNELADELSKKAIEKHLKL